MDKELELIEAFGHITGFRVSSLSELTDLVSDFPKEYYTSLKDLEDLDSLIYLADLYISPEFRGRGLASDILTKFLKTHQETILLIAGSLETPKNFEIVAFYESFGFELLADEFEFPLMIKKTI